MSVAVLTVGDVMAELKQMASESVQCAVTSPPYWGLRDYGVEGQLGLEKTPGEYVAKMVAVLREVRRVLRPDGTLWLNIGDSYAGSRKGGNPEAGTKQGTNAGSQSVGVLYGLDATDRATERARIKEQFEAEKSAGLKQKDLVGIPWLLAFALRADGWYLRSEIIWHKPNPMPESVTDRPTKAHETIFLLSKSPKYFYDADAIKEECVKGAAGSEFHTGKTGEHQLGRASTKPRKSNKQAGHGRRHAGFNDRWDAAESNGAAHEFRNKRSVWTIPPQPFRGAHFATFPEKLVEPCILAGSAPDDLVLDPFAGSCTTAVVALRHERNFVGIELSPTYAEIARQRVEKSGVGELLVC